MALSQKKSCKLWVWKARDRAAERLVDWELGSHDRAACKRLLERLRRFGVCLDCADGWEAYAEIIPQGQIHVGKDETRGIERDHACQRHRLARFQRRSIFVAKAARMVDASITPLARFGSNDRIG